MKRLEALKRIQALFTKDFKNAKLEDGTIIQWEGELEEGVAIAVVAEDGNIMTAPDATHVLEDGTKVTTLGGLVTSIEKVEEKEIEDKKDEEMANEFEKAFANHVGEFAKLIERVASLETKLTEYESKFTEVEKVVADTNTTTENKFKEIKAIVELIAEEPQGEPVKPVAGKFSFINKQKPTKSSVDAYLEYKKNKNI